MILAYDQGHLMPLEFAAEVKRQTCVPSQEEECQVTVNSDVGNFAPCPLGSSRDWVEIFPVVKCIEVLCNIYVSMKLSPISENWETVTCYQE